MSEPGQHASRAADHPLRRPAPVMSTAVSAPFAAAGRRWQTLLTALALFVAALVPRAFSGRFLTIDEGYHWIARVALFEQALAERKFAATNLIGHPGVTTLWLG